MSSAAAQAAKWIAGAEQVFVLSGAGLSTESGIPDFRGPNGLWTRNPDAVRMFDLDAYRTDPALRRNAWQIRRSSEMWQAEPNHGHLALTAWAKEHRQVTIATQNIDGLHQRAGSKDVLELHGTAWFSMCLSCDDRRPIHETFARLEDGDPDPACLVCGGILKSATISFGQELDPSVLAAAADAASKCDVALAIGTSLVVQPAAGLCSVALQGGARLIIVNGDDTPYDHYAHLVVNDRIGPTLAAITDLLRR